MANQNDEYIPVETAADLLQLGVRMVNRYGNPAYNRLQTRKVGRRVLYRKADVLALADELGVAHQPLSRLRASSVLKMNAPGDCSCRHRRTGRMSIPPLHQGAL